MDITYTHTSTITAHQFQSILRASTLAERRPADDIPRLQKMLDHADIIVTAWDSERLIGIARAITDYSYATYLSDIAVDLDYQKKGIGKELMRRARQVAGKEVNFFLFAAPKAKDYYGHVGFQAITRGWILTEDDEIK